MPQLSEPPAHLDEAHWTQPDQPDDEPLCHVIPALQREAASKMDRMLRADP